MLWDSGLGIQGISINTLSERSRHVCGGSAAQNVGSVTLIDSSITNTPTLDHHSLRRTVFTTGATAGSLIVENVVLTMFQLPIQSDNNTILAGYRQELRPSAAWGEGHEYTPTGPKAIQGPFTSNSEAGFASGMERYYTSVQASIQYSSRSLFLQVQEVLEPKDDGVTDDTPACRIASMRATALGQIVFSTLGPT